MYGNPPIFLPPVSNREDLLISISIFDDDTGQPVNLSGTVTARGAPFSGANWVVTDGPIATTSITLLTIPVPPIGGQTSGTLVVPPGLGMLGGDAVKIADPTGLNYMLGTVSSYNNATGLLVCQIGSTFQFEIRRGPPRNDGSGYVPWYDFGTPDDQGPLLSAALGTGITIVDIGYLQVLIPAVIFQQLNIGTFMASMTMSDGVATRQVFLANLPVLYGGVRTSTSAISATAGAASEGPRWN
jgi:hypothetical protein